MTNTTKIRIPNSAHNHCSLDNLSRMLTLIHYSENHSLFVHSKCKKSLSRIQPQEQRFSKENKIQGTNFYTRGFILKKTLVQDNLDRSAIRF